MSNLSNIQKSMNKLLLVSDVKVGASVMASAEDTFISIKCIDKSTAYILLGLLEEAKHVVLSRLKIKEETKDSKGEDIDFPKEFYD